VSRAAEGWRARLRHAFAVDPPGPAAPTVDEEASVEWLCRQVSRRGLTTPALVALETCRPLNGLSSASLRMLQPTIEVLLPETAATNVEHFASFLEKRGSVDHLVERLETLEAQREDARRAARRDAAPDAADAADATNPAESATRTEDDVEP